MDNRRMADLSQIDRFIVRAMVSGASDALAPLSVISTQDGLLGIYDLIGLTDVSRLDIDAVTVLDLTARILEALDSLKDILIFPEDLVLNEKVIFMDDNTGNIMICAIPGNGEATEKENVAFLIDRLKNVTDEKGKEYLEILRKEYLERNYSHFGLLSMMEDMKREAGY